MLGEWITVPESAERTGRTVQTIYNWVNEGNIRTARPMKMLWLYLPDVLKVEREKATRRKGVDL
tara:strand:- start:1700 stop:1891 length:192 start_codon:yes stop_codon:yes gene_type:complete